MAVPHAGGAPSPQASPFTAASSVLATTAIAGATVLDLVSSGGFRAGDHLFIGTTAGTHGVAVIDSIAGDEVTLTAPTAVQFNAGTLVQRTPSEAVDARGAFPTLDDRLDVTDAEIAAARDGAPSLLARLDLVERGVVNVKAHGAIGDGVANDTTEVQAAMDAAVGSILHFPPGTYLVDDLTVPSGITLTGAGRDHSVLKASGGGAYLLDLEDGRDITIRDLAVDCSASVIGGIKLSNLTEPGTATSGNVLIEDCKIDVSAGDLTGILLEGYVEDVTIRGCHIIGNDNPDKDSTTAYLIYRKNPQVESYTDRPVWIDGCRLEQGRVAFIHDASGNANGPTWFTNNLVTGQLGFGAYFYNNQGVMVTGNIFENITHRLSTGASTEGGIVWLDLAGQSHVAQFHNNTIRNCIGNGIYIEDYYGVISGWHIVELTKRTLDTYTGTNGVTSDGGHGVLVGASAHLTLDGLRVGRCDGDGIRIARDLGIHTTAAVTYVKISNCVIAENGENGILVVGEAVHVAVHDTIIDNNGFNDPAGTTFAGIGVAPNSVAEVLDSLTIIGCFFDIQANTGQWRGYNRAVEGGFHVISNNVWYTGGGQWIRVPTNSIGILVGNDFRGTSTGLTLPTVAGTWQRFGNSGTADTNDIGLNDGYVQLVEKTADAGAPAGNVGRLYTRDNGAGKTQLVVRFASGAIQVLATQP